MAVLVAGTAHGDDHLRRQRHDAFIRQRPEPGNAGGDVGRPGELENGVRAGVCPAHHHAPVLDAEDEQGAHGIPDPALEFRHRREIFHHLLCKFLAIGLGADNLGDQAYLADDALGGTIVADLDERDAGGLQDADHLGRTGA